MPLFSLHATLHAINLKTILGPHMLIELYIILINYSDDVIPIQDIFQIEEIFLAIIFLVFCKYQTVQYKLNECILIEEKHE